MTLELVRVPGELWCSCGFRPIYPGGALTQLLMQPIPAEPDRELVTADLTRPPAP